MNAAMAAFTGHPSMKQVIIVDKDVDIFDDKAVEWAVATRFQASRGLLVVNNAAGSSLDPSTEGTTSKIAIDATMPIGDAKLFEKPCWTKKGEPKGFAGRLKRSSRIRELRHFRSIWVNSSATIIYNHQRIDWKRCFSLEMQ